MQGFSLGIIHQSDRGQAFAGPARDARKAVAWRACADLCTCSSPPPLQPSFCRFRAVRWCDPRPLPGPACCSRCCRPTCCCWASGTMRPSTSNCSARPWSGWPARAGWRRWCWRWPNRAMAPRACRATPANPPCRPRWPGTTAPGPGASTAPSPWRRYVPACPCSAATCPGVSSAPRSPTARSKPC